MKRFRIVLVIAVVFALGIVVDASVRRTPSDGYGRLFSQQVAVRNDDLQPRKVQVVPEAPVQPTATSADVLTATSATEQPAGSGATTVAAATAPAPDGMLRPSHSRFVIVGDASGVSVVKR